MTIRVESRPDTPGVRNALEKIDFYDTYATTNHQHSLEKITIMLLGDGPNWVRWLMNVRNRAVSVFGLKTADYDANNIQFEQGGHIGFFKIYSINHNEIILGEDDKHLNFRVSIYNSGEPKYNIKATTLVQYNNAFGKLYLKTIMPCHKIIVKSMLKKISPESS